jgi:hypothetical protein
VGGIGGAIGGARAKKAYKAAMRTNGRARQAIVAEFAVCIVIAALSPLTDRRKTETPGGFMKRMTALMAVFLILGLISSFGRTASRLAAGVGGLVTVALAVSERDLFTKVGGIFGSTTDAPAPGTGPMGAEDAAVLGEDVGTSIGDVLGQVGG